MADEAVALAECPIGLFFSADGELCLKTEYGDNEGRIDAYIVSSGEFFWGDAPQTIARQRQQMVTPVDLLATLAARERDEALHDYAQADSLRADLHQLVIAAERELDALREALKRCLPVDEEGKRLRDAALAPRPPL